MKDLLDHITESASTKYYIVVNQEDRQMRYNPNDIDGEYTVFTDYDEALNCASETNRQTKKVVFITDLNNKVINRIG